MSQGERGEMSYQNAILRVDLKTGHTSTEPVTEELPDWEIMVGPREAAHLLSYLKNNWKA